jgi:DNA polymerase III epsilon subunit-like protein
MDRVITETPIAVLDFETTGLNAGPDRVVEVAVVRMEPGQESRLAVNTLVNPNRKMAATEIHGITEDDVKDAPLFEDIAASFLGAANGAVLASYNVYFDIRFLEYELGRVGIRWTPPHVCLMYLRPLLGLGGKCSLEEACRAHGVPQAAAHQAAADALSGAALWNVYTDSMRNQGIRSFQDLCSLAQYKFLASLSSSPFAPRDLTSMRLGIAPKPRPVPAMTAPEAPQVKAARGAPRGRQAARTYWEALKVVLADFEVTDEEVRSLTALRGDLGLTEPQVRAMHGKAFADLLSQAVEDRVLDDAETADLRRLHLCLGRLGWAPGL